MKKTTKMKVRIDWVDKNGKNMVDEFLAPSTKLSDTIRFFETTIGRNLNRVVKIETADESDIVKIKTYGMWEERNRLDAIKFYEECAAGSEGAERERYQYVIDQCRAGKTVIDSDGARY